MKAKYLIILFIFLIGIYSLNFVSASLCYQETANISTSCGGLNTGLYSSSWDGSHYGWGSNINNNGMVNLTDGDWSTGTITAEILDTSYFYINYTKPILSDNLSLWQVSDNTNMGVANPRNLTINNSCWKAFNNTIELRIIQIPSVCQINYQCYNSSDWLILENYTFGSGTCFTDLPSSKINEEAIIWNFKAFNENSQSFNSSTQSGSSETFSINLTYDSNYYSNIAVVLVYNNTNYSTSTSNIGNNKLFSTTIIVPNVATITNKSFYYIISLTNSTGTIIFNSTSNNQSVSPFLIDNCGSYTRDLLNFAMIDEESLLPINGTIELAVNFYSLNYDLIGSYNTSFNYITNTLSRVCINNLSSNYLMDYTIRHYGNSTTYFKKYRNIQKMVINNNTAVQNIILYNLLQSSGYPFTIKVVGNILSSNGNSDLLVSVQRQYIPQNSFNLIESSITDSIGNAILNLVQQTVVYNFVVSYNGVVLGTFNNYQVKCTNPSINQCTITLSLSQATTDINNIINDKYISHVYLLDNTTKNIYLSYNSIDGNSHTVSTVIIQDDGYGNTTICNVSGTGTSGTIFCYIPTNFQKSNFFAKLYSDGIYISSTYFSQGDNFDYYGVDIIIEILLFTSLVLLFISHPILIVVGGILGIAMAFILLFITAGSLPSIISAVIYFICAGGIIIWQISRKI